MVSLLNIMNIKLSWPHSRVFRVLLLTLNCSKLLAVFYYFIKRGGLYISRSNYTFLLFQSILKGFKNKILLESLSTNKYLVLLFVKFIYAIKGGTNKLGSTTFSKTSNSWSPKSLTNELELAKLVFKAYTIKLMCNSIRGLIFSLIRTTWKAN